MKRPFTLYSMKRSTKPSKRISMGMKPQLTECEWLWEATGSCPEQSLGIAVLQRAVLDLITPGVQERDRLDAARWIDSHEDEHPLSFCRIVESFTDISTEEFRCKLLAWVEGARLPEGNADVFRFQRS